MFKISKTGWAPGSVGSDEQHLPQSKRTWQTKSFCHLLRCFPDGKYHKSIFFSFHLCPLRDILSPPGKTWWWIFNPWCFSGKGREYNETTLHKTKLVQAVYHFFFMFFFLFFNGGGNREGGKKRVVWVQAAAFWKSSHTKAFFLHLSVLLIAPCSISPREELHYMHNLKQLFFLSCFFLIVLKSAILEVKRHEFDSQTQRQCFFCSLSWFISRSFCYCCHIYSHGPSCRQSIVRGLSCLL